MLSTVPILRNIDFALEELIVTESEEQTWKTMKNSQIMYQHVQNSQPLSTLLTEMCDVDMMREQPTIFLSDISVSEYEMN
jgi:hypothetical protein